MRTEVANTADAKAIAKLHVDSWRATYRGIVPDKHLHELSYDTREAMWKGILSRKSPRCHTQITRDASGNIIGFVSTGPSRDQSVEFDGELYALYVDKKFHKQGIGKKLVTSALEQLFRDGFLNCCVWVLNDNPAIRFYQKLGGEVVGEKLEDIGGAKLPETALGWTNILGALRALNPKGRHPNIKHYTELQEPDGENHYPGSKELHSIGSPFARAGGLRKLGIHHELLPPGRRTSWPHAEQDEEEFIYVIDGHPQVWIDGELHQLNPGDGVTFCSGTGISHTFLNNTDQDVRLLVVGEASKKDSKIYYPLHPSRKEQVTENWWHDVPKRPLGEHDATPQKNSGSRGADS